MDTINNDIYLSTIFNACEEKVLTYEELLQKVNSYAKNANYDEETLRSILEEVEKFNIHKKEYSNAEKREYLSKLMLDENVEKYGSKLVDSMNDDAVDKVFLNEVKEIKDEDIDKIINPKKGPVKVKVRVRNEIPNIEVAKEVANSNDKLEIALTDTYNGVTIEEILNALIDSRKKGMNIPTTQPMEHLIMYYALRGKKDLSLDEKQRSLREIGIERQREKEIIKKVLAKIKENEKNNAVEEKKEETEVKQEEIKNEEQVLVEEDKFNKELVREVANNNYYLERAILLGSYNGTKLEDILDGVIKLRKSGEEIICTKEMNYLVDSYAIFGKLNSTILNSTLDKIATIRNVEEKKSVKEETENKNDNVNIELAKELSSNSVMLEASLVSRMYKGVSLDLIVKEIVDAKKQGIQIDTNEAMNVLVSSYEKEGKITEESINIAKQILAKERLNSEKTNEENGVMFANSKVDDLDNDNKTVETEEKKEDNPKKPVININDFDEDTFKNVEKNMNDAKDSNVEVVDAKKERIEKLKKSKILKKTYFLKGAIIVTSFAMLGPEISVLGLIGYNAYAIAIREGRYNPKTKIGTSIKDTVLRIMTIGYTSKEREDLLDAIAQKEAEVNKKEEERGKSK